MSVDVVAQVSALRAKHFDARARIKAALDLVIIDPEILSGTPVIRGTRVPVFDVIASLRKGIDEVSIRPAYPSLSDDDFALVKIYAAAVPSP